MSEQIVSFHLGYSATRVFKMTAFPNIPVSETIIADRNELLNILGLNLATLSTNLYPRRVSIEILDWNRKGKEIPWDKQNQEALDNREKIQQVVDRYGANAGLLHVTEPDFVEKVLEINDKHCPENPAGFTFDVAHIFISADAKIHDGLFFGSIEDYFQSMLDVVADRICQLHLTVPAGNDEIGYADHHCAFMPGDPLSDRIMKLSKMVFQQTPNVEFITLEIKTDLPSIEHAKKMIKQAEYIIKELDL